MKSTQFLSMVSVLGLAASVTAGTMYVTVRAAVQQEADVAVEAPAGQGALSEVVAEVAEAMNAPLKPEEIIHNRSHDIVLTESGTFSGQLHTLDNGMTAAGGFIVRLLQNGAVAAESKSDKNGKFTIEGAKPGVAGLLAFSEKGFLLFGVRLVAQDADHPATEGLALESALVASTDLALVKQIISSQLADEDLRFVNEVEEAEEEFSFGVGDTATSMVGHRVQLRQDGSLYGIVNLLDDRTGRIREIIDLTIYFLRDGRVVAKKEVENNGEFVVNGLTAGVHSAIGVGRDGTFAFGVEVFGSEAQLNASRMSLSDYQAVSIAEALDLAVAPVNAENFNTQNAEQATNGNVGPSGTPGPETPGSPAGGTGGGGAGAAGGGGAGAAGGGGGLGALVGAGIAGGVGYLAGQNNNDTPSSPE